MSKKWVGYMPEIVALVGFSFLTVSLVLFFLLLRWLELSPERLFLWSVVDFGCFALGVFLAFGGWAFSGWRKKHGVLQA